MDWGDALFCFVAGLLAVAIVMVSRNLQRLAIAIEKLAPQPVSAQHAEVHSPDPVRRFFEPAYEFGLTPTLIARL